MLTSIGSWPEVPIETALDWAFTLDLPALPELPGRGPEHDMIGALLQGGPVTRSAFLARIDRQRPTWSKMQTIGPITLTELARRGEPRLRSRTQAELEDAVHTRAEADARAILELGCAPVIYFDEPLLFATPGEACRLAPLIHDLQCIGARVGLHSCGPMPWNSVLDLGLDFIAFDATQRSWPLPSAEGLARFRARGGRLVLGAVSRFETAPVSYLHTRYGADVDLSFTCGLAGAEAGEVPALVLRLQQLRDGSGSRTPSTYSG
jgi:hypothetical protein